MSSSFHEHFVLDQDVFLLFEFVSLSVFIISALSLCFKQSDIFCGKHSTAFLEHLMSKGKQPPLFALKFGTFILS